MLPMLLNIKEGLVATTSVHQKNETAAWRIREIVDVKP